MNNGLPSGWTLASLEELVEDPMQDIVDGPFGSNLKASSYVPAGVPIVRLQNIDRNRFLDKNIRFVTLEKAAELARHSFCAGDIVITKLGDPVGKACIVPPRLPEGIIVADVVRARIDERRSLVQFVAYAINSPQLCSQLNLEVKGSTRPRVNLRHIRSFKIRVAPLNEQSRIVAKLEKLLDKVDSCQKRLAKISILLKRFRQAVLATACSGQLTLDWRQKSQSCSEFVDLDLPGGWNWQTIRNLVGPSGLFDGPFGSNLKTADYTGHGVRVVRLENIGHLKFLNEKKAFISEQKYQNLRKHTVRDGDIIFSSFIDEEIRVCVLPPLPTQAIAKADCFCLRPNRDSVDIRYLTLQLAAPATYNRLLEKVHGATRPRINTTQLRDLIVPVCPPDEQHEIVRRVDELFALADQVESRYSKAKQYVDGLKQSILARAFRGELVPQDPKDEPATALLERIREARSSEPSKRLVKRTSKSGVQSVS